MLGLGGKPQGQLLTGCMLALGAWLMKIGLERGYCLFSTTHMLRMSTGLSIDKCFHADI